MNRVIVSGALIGAFLCFCSARAQALSEFCPATLEIAPVGNVQRGVAASLYGFALTAFGPRTVRATLAFDTLAGWFTVSVPTTSLQEKDRRFTGRSSNWVQREWVSPIMYIRFPNAVNIAHSWVYSAEAAQDPTFHWDAQGKVTCPPHAASTIGPVRGSSFARMNPADQDQLSTAPNAASQILTPQKTQALESTQCGIPFQDATVFVNGVPEYPSVMMAEPTDFTSVVEVAINADGTLKDAWLWAPSGNYAFDGAALHAARTSQYRNGVAYCKAVPGYYLFAVTFSRQGFP